ncbi:prepilin peptidase [Latilactobacillus graminis]|uniref:Leader peptidase (Prepilin peptidase) / N-methyltransferase n=2 Tax=Latilactobacillus graminis TaxID=60519 RepID=A0AA89KXK4_9LACO|nr:A24 family peptidase [Latilactobacillus graminis]KRM23342.1 hypothetical protein FC90_GL000444 [Latilactobacillus graminis DSM 20719]QFP78897.1 prepilin peptidase [Latilactobacillus graminis]
MLLYLTIFYAGACCASFLSVCAWRLPQGRSIVAPRSQCDNCHQQLAWFDLLPLISYLILQGKCRTCGKWINFYFWGSEFSGGLLACFCWSHSWSLATIYLLVLLFEMSLVDLFHRILYPIPMLIAMAPLFYHYWSQNYWLSACLTGIIFCAFANWSAGFGLGDAELISILTLWLGFEAILQVLLVACLSCLLLYGIRRTLSKPCNYQIPFIPYILAGVVMLLGHGICP